MISEKAGRNILVGKHDLRDSSKLFLIAGPCVIESEDVVMKVAAEVKRIGEIFDIPVLFKSSFDKANRTSIHSFRGPGIVKGLEILSKVRERFSIPVVSDIHVPDQATLAGQVLDVIQIPAFLSRQTDLLVAAARTGKTVNIKKGQFQAHEDINYAIGKVSGSGSDNILVTERGSSFGYHDLVVDMRSIPMMKKLGYPVVFDATHSAQKPSAAEGKSGGNRELAEPLAMAAVAAGANGIFIETHPDPESALCDGPNSMELSRLERVMAKLIRIHSIASEDTDSDFETTLPVMPCHKKTDQELTSGLSKIKLIIFDVDGILTDGRIVFGNNDLEIKSFDVRDGHGIKIAKRFGLDIALVTGRSSKSVRWRASDLGIDHVYQGIWDKKPVLDRIVQQLGIENDQVAVVGDDVVDIPMMRLAGVSFTVPEAPFEVLNAATVITQHSGGRGAAREVVEMILKAQGKWQQAMKRYLQ